MATMAEEAEQPYRSARGAADDAFWRGEHALAAALAVEDVELQALALCLDERHDEARALSPRGLARGFLAFRDGDPGTARRVFEAHAADAHLGALARFGLAGVVARRSPRKAARMLDALVASDDGTFVPRWAGNVRDALVVPRRSGNALVLGVGVAILVIAAVLVAITYPRREHRECTVSETSAALALGQAGKADVYFVAGAAWGDQDVFHNEVLTAARVVERRFASRDHTLLLSNDIRASGTFPPFTTGNLREAIGAVGARMNRDEDVLFLYLTSHGSDEGLAISVPWLGVRETLSPEALRSMLDEAQIRWRVLVIAGCETGTFLETLATPETAILTAAAIDHASYGCANGRPSTDFGRSVFTQLENVTDVVGSFRAAVEMIATQESDAGLAPSRPELVEGSAIGAKLEQLGRR